MHPLAQEKRRRICDFLADHPGTHLRELQRRLAMSGGTLEYHLHVLCRQGILAARRDGRYARYYVASRVDRREKHLLAILRQPVPRRVCIALLDQPDQSHAELLRHFDLAPSTLSFHLKKLLQEGLVEVRREGRQRRYRVSQPVALLSALQAYRPSYADEALERLLGAPGPTAPPQPRPAAPPPRPAPHAPPAAATPSPATAPPSPPSPSSPPAPAHALLAAWA